MSPIMTGQTPERRTVWIADGGRNVQPIIESSWGEPSFHCLDPDGNLVEVLEKRPSKESSWRR
jgi:hypothetical protein